MVIIETIKIKIRLLSDKFAKSMKEAEKKMQAFNHKALQQGDALANMSSKMKASGERTKAFEDQNMRLGQVFGMGMERWKAFNEQGFRFNTVSGRAANKIRKLTHGMRGFRMEMLGVMFFGMAMTRMMGGLINKSLEWSGAFEIMSTALGILFLPLAMKLTEWALKFLDWVGGLTEKQKKWIGILVASIAVLGMFLFIVGTMALGIGSIIQVFGKMAIFFKLKTLAIVLIIAGIGLAISGVMDIINNWGKDWNKVVDGIKKVLFGLGLVLLGIAIIIGSIPLAIFAAGVLIIAAIVWLIHKIINNWQKIKDFLGGVWDGFINGIKSAWEWVKNIGKKIKDYLSGSMIGKVFLSVAGAISGKRALGGPVGAGKSYLVGERGPELFTPNNSGKITSNNDLVGGSRGGFSQVSAPNITINAKISNDYDVRRLADELKRYWVEDFERVSQGRGF